MRWIARFIMPPLDDRCRLHYLIAGGGIMLGRLSLAATLNHYRGEFMSDVIDFMERMGGDAQLSQASPGELATALADSEVTPEQRMALLAHDAERLGELLGTNPACALLTPPGPGPSPAEPMTPAKMPPPPEPEEAEDEEGA